MEWLEVAPRASQRPSTTKSLSLLAPHGEPSVASNENRRVPRAAGATRSRPGRSSERNSWHDTATGLGLPGARDQPVEHDVAEGTGEPYRVAFEVVAEELEQRLLAACLSERDDGEQDGVKWKVADHALLG